MQPSVLGRVQRGLECLYRVNTQLAVDEYVLDDSSRDQALREGTGAVRGEGTHRRPREQLVIKQTRDELRLGLFLEAEVIDTLERNDPTLRLTEINFWPLCLAVEGISHFIYVARCAARDRPVRALELELQAEVDKFVTCFLLCEQAQQKAADHLCRRLFETTHLAADLSQVEVTRYEKAQRSGHAYVRSLLRRFVGAGRILEMLEELRLFYREPLPGKLSLISNATR